MSNAEPILSSTQSIVSHADQTITGAASAASVLAANPARLSVIVQNTGGSNNARIGDDTTASGVGYVLAPGDSIKLDTTAAIYCYSASGTAIGCTEIVEP